MKHGMKPFKQFTDALKPIGLTADQLMVVVGAGQELDGFYREVLVKQGEELTKLRKERK